MDTITKFEKFLDEAKGLKSSEIENFRDFISKANELKQIDIKIFKNFLIEATKSRERDFKAFKSFINKANSIKKIDLMTFNILKVLGVERREISHTYLISWLLNPEESHRLRDLFLTKFFSTLDLAYLNLKNVDISPFQHSPDGSSEVDIIIENEEFRAIIENKITHMASNEQLKREIEKFDCGNKEFIPIYLTPFKDFKDRPEEIKVVTYTDIKNILESVLPHCSNEVKILIDHYIKVLDKIIQKY